MIQLVSQLCPSSNEYACSHLAEVVVMRDQRKRTRARRPLTSSSPKNLPTLFSNRPRKGGSRPVDGFRPSIHQIDHRLAAVSYERKAIAAWV